MMDEKHFNEFRAKDRLHVLPYEVLIEVFKAFKAYKSNKISKEELIEVFAKNDITIDKFATRYNTESLRRAHERMMKLKEPEVITPNLVLHIEISSEKYGLKNVRMWHNDRLALEVLARTGDEEAQKGVEGLERWEAGHTKKHTENGEEKEL